MHASCCSGSLCLLSSRLVPLAWFLCPRLFLSPSVPIPRDRSTLCSSSSLFSLFSPSSLSPAWRALPVCRACRTLRPCLPPPCLSSPLSSTHFLPHLRSSTCRRPRACGRTSLKGQSELAAAMPHSERSSALVWAWQAARRRCAALRCAWADESRASQRVQRPPASVLRTCAAPLCCSCVKPPPPAYSLARRLPCSLPMHRMRRQGVEFRVQCRSRIAVRRCNSGLHRVPSKCVGESPRRVAARCSCRRHPQRGSSACAACQHDACSSRSETVHGPLAVTVCVC